MNLKAKGFFVENAFKKNSDDQPDSKMNGTEDPKSPSKDSKSLKIKLQEVKNVGKIRTAL